MIFPPTALSPIQRATAPVARKGRQPSRFFPNIKPRAWMMKVFCYLMKDRIYFIIHDKSFFQYTGNTREALKNSRELGILNTGVGGWFVCRGRSWRCKGDYDSSIRDYHFCTAIF